MLSIYQILQQSFEINGSYPTTHKPLRNRKFAKLSNFLQKETGASPICVDESHVTCLLWAKILAKAGFYAGPTVDALEEAN